MIYGCLTPIRQWANPTTLPVYLALSLMSGACWLQALMTGFGIGSYLYKPGATIAEIATRATAVVAAYDRAKKR